MERSRWDKFRILTIGLIFSGALNIGLILALVFSVLEEGEAPIVTLKAQTQTICPPPNQQQLLAMLKLSFSELLVFLTNREPVEDGYFKRDLALSALVSSHFFNLEKALAAAPSQKRLLTLSPEQTIEIYPGLGDEQYEAIIRFAYQEKWPLTAKGLFHILKKLPRENREESLCQAFFSTPEFYQLQVLFQKSEKPVESSALLDLVVEGPWELFENFAKEQVAHLDLSSGKRRSLLFSYMACRSQKAADLFLETDFSFAKTRLEDDNILAFLELVHEKTPKAERFCVDLLYSPRSDAVWRAAGLKLYSLAKEKAPIPFDRNEALLRFANPSETKASHGAPAQTESIAAQKPLNGLRQHVVQEGESLWKISRLYKVKIEDLVALNGLEKDRLLPGMILCIP